MLGADYVSGVGGCLAKFLFPAPFASSNRLVARNCGFRVLGPAPPGTVNDPVFAPSSKTQGQVQQQEPPTASSSTRGKAAGNLKKKATSVVAWGVALYDYTATDDSEVSFRAGDWLQITALPAKDGWGRYIVNGTSQGEGYYPGNAYVEVRGGGGETRQRANHAGESYGSWVHPMVASNNEANCLKHGTT